MDKFNSNCSYLHCPYCNGYFQNQNYDDEGNWQENPEALNDLMWGDKGHWKLCIQSNPHIDNRGFYNVSVEIFQSTPQSKEPNTKGFNTAMLADAEYNRIINQTSNQRAVTRLENLSIQGNENYDFYKLFWDAIIDGLLVKPNSNRVEKWNEFCVNNDMPFKFGKSGEMILHATN